MLVTLMLAPAWGVDITRPASTSKVGGAHSASPASWARPPRLPRSLQVAGRHVDALQALFDRQVARGQLEDHAADLVARPATSRICAPADRAAHAHLRP